MLALPLLHILISLGSGLTAGVLAGLFGVGGGTLVVPMLMVLGADIRQAVAMSLVYILFTSLSGSQVSWRQGLLEPRAILTISLSSGLAIYAGVHLTLRLDAAQVAWLFTGFILLVLGLIASVLGVGGGLVMVPILVLLAGMNLKSATANSLACVCLIACIGMFQHALFGKLLPAVGRFGPALLLMSLAGMAGAPLGIRLNHRLPEAWLRRGFVLLCLTVMAYMIHQGLTVGG